VREAQARQAGAEQRAHIKNILFFKPAPGENPNAFLSGGSPRLHGARAARLA
jgi:hypothetical protein